MLRSGVQQQKKKNHKQTDQPIFFSFNAKKVNILFTLSVCLMTTTAANISHCAKDKDTLETNKMKIKKNQQQQQQQSSE